MSNQRVITSTLKDMVKTLDTNGEQRPPGTMVIGWSVLRSAGTEMSHCWTIMTKAERVSRWLCGNDAVDWKAQEGP